MRGLRENGVEVIECNDRSRGLMKYWRLYKKHVQIKNQYDVMIVGYPSQITVWLAKLISSKKVVLDALASLYEGEIISRQSANKFSLKAFKTWLVDYIAYQCADLILVETHAQAEFFAKTFYVARNKCKRVFTGALDTVFYPDPTVQKKEKFTAVFRGQFLPEAGADIIRAAGKLLESKDTDVLFIGKGTVPPDDLRRMMLACHVSLGQFADHERLKRTIPHKAFESLALGLPYVTGRAGGISELLTDRENCLMTKLGDAQDLADKILDIKNNPALAEKIAAVGLALYREKLTPKVLAGEILNVIR